MARLEYTVPVELLCVLDRSIQPLQNQGNRCVWLVSRDHDKKKALKISFECLSKTIS
jgi:hypothetical protein